MKRPLAERRSGALHHLATCEGTCTDTPDADELTSAAMHQLREHHLGRAAADTVTRTFHTLLRHDLSENDLDRVAMDGPMSDETSLRLLLDHPNVTPALAVEAGWNVHSRRVALRGTTPERDRLLKVLADGGNGGKTASVLLDAGAGDDEHGYTRLGLEAAKSPKAVLEILETLLADTRSKRMSTPELEAHIAAARTLARSSR